MLTCSDQTVEPACRVIEVVRDQWIGTAEQVQQHKEILERKLKEKAGFLHRFHSKKCKHFLKIFQHIIAAVNSDIYKCIQSKRLFHFMTVNQMLLCCKASKLFHDWILQKSYKSKGLLKNPKAMSLSRNNDPIARDNPQTCEQFHVGTICTELHLTNSVTVQDEACLYS